MKPEDLHPWFYPVTIDGKDVACGVYPKGEGHDRPGWSLVVRQNLRRTILVGELTKRVDFEGLRILDLACNCGFWSSIYIKGYGAAGVLGIEGRELFIKQADMLYTDMGIRGRAHFVLGDVMDLGYDVMEGQHDFIMCAGLLYHLPDPTALVRKMASINAKYMMLDTRLWENGKTLDEKPTLRFNSIPKYSKVNLFDKQVLLNLVHSLGYKTEILPVGFPTLGPVSQGDDYAAGKRISLLCTRDY